jgi:hypothetical protein
VKVARPVRGSDIGETTRGNPGTAPRVDSYWADGGPTDLGNLVLLCPLHHRLLHRSGWEVRIATDGLPEFLPPMFLDKQRKPRRNNLHQPLAA